MHRPAESDPATRPSVTTERRGPVLVVRMDRPARRNAIDATMTAGLDAALNELDDDPGLRVGVLTGSSEVFSAGTDLLGGPGAPSPRGGEYGVARRRRRTPLIAAVEGPALGGGFELVLACDLVVASRTALLGLPEVQLGLVANCGGLFRGPRQLPLNVARKMLLTGAPITVERAWSLGLVNVISEPGGAVEGALALAGRVCAASPAAVAASLEAMEAAFNDADADGWQATKSAWTQVTASVDSEEGVSAFLERRAPRWSSP